MYNVCAEESCIHGMSDITGKKIVVICFEIIILFNKRKFICSSLHISPKLFSLFSELLPFLI